MEGKMLSGCSKSAFFLYFLLLLDGIFLHCHAGGLCQHYQFVVKEAPYTRLCKTKKILTVNGQFAGPTLHVHKGDEIVVDVYNRGNHKYHSSLECGTCTVTCSAT